MPRISARDALELARQYKESAVSLGSYQLEHWDGLTAAQRKQLTDEEYTLLDQSQLLVTYAVGIQLDDAQASLARIREATMAANRALRRIQDLKQALGVVTALVTLGAALTSGNPLAVAESLKGLVDATPAS